jgi:glutaconate CoA-transferase subunit A
VEEIVDEQVICADPNRTLIPGLIVDAVVHEPYGAHPSYVHGYYDRDNDLYLDWDRISQEADSVQQWLDTWVYGVRDRAEYISKLGEDALQRLDPGEAWSAAVNYGAYQ